MQPFKHHLFVCTQQKPDWAPSCPGKGAPEVIAALKKEISAHNLDDQVLVTTSGCLGLCADGPNLVIYPGGWWYTGLTPEDAAEIVKEHLAGDRPVERLLQADPEALNKDIRDHFIKIGAMKQHLEKSGMLPDALQGLFRGFMENRIALTGLEMDLFSKVGEGATAAEVAEKTGASLRGIEAELNALAAIGLLNKEGGRFTNTADSARYLAEGGEHDSRQALMHGANLWHRWSTLTECVKEGTSVTRDKPRTEDDTTSFIAAMHKNAKTAAAQVVAMLDLAGVKKMLDLGGGSGAYAMAFAAAKDDLKAVVFDLPKVTKLTRGYIEEAAMTDRVTTMDGDMMEDDYGEGYDLVLISAISHMWSPEENRKLFEKIHKALKPGGRVVVQDFLLNEDKTSPRFAAVFSINMLVNTRGGASYSASEYTGWLGEAGFSEVEVKKLMGPTDLVIGRKPV